MHLSLFATLVVIALSGLAKVQSKKIECGRVNRLNRIVGGQQTDKNEYPWQAAIVRKSPPGYHPSWHPFCGGSLISKKWVISAAHCFFGTKEAKDIQVIFGEHDWKNQEETVTVRRDVKRIENHVKYNNKNQQYDYALLELASPVPLSKHIAPVCPPDNVVTKEGSTVIATGWGTTSSGGDQPDHLLEVVLKIVGNERCKKLNYPSTINSNNICASAAEGGKDACQGDSGGPLVQQNSAGAYELVGVTSFGRGCGKKNHPGVWSGILEAMPWIMRKTGGWSTTYIESN